MNSSKKTNLLLNLLFLLLIIVTNKSYGMIVYDPVNWLQNWTTAVNTTRQLINQTHQIEMELSDLKNYQVGIGQWANVQGLLQQLASQAQQGQALAYNMQNLDQAFQQRYPGFKASQNYQQDYQNWSQTTLDTLRGTLESAGLQASQFNNEQTLINQLSTLSQTAEGRMQAIQVGNMLATQQVAQMQQLRQLMINQTNAQNAYMAYEVQKDQSNQATESEWIKASIKKFPDYGSSKGFNQNDIPSFKGR